MLLRQRGHVDADFAEQHALGSATNLFPGPTMMSAGLPVNSPKAIAAIACGLRGCNRHVSRRDVRIAPRGNVTAGHIDRDQPLAGREPRLHLDGEFADRFTLGLREAAYSLRCE